MQRLKCTMAYDGTQFSGYQVQPNKRTIQLEVESALKNLHKGKEVKIYASGRTDAGVHAKGQVFHFDTPLQIPTDKWPIALNSLLPSDVSILHSEEVDASFHARFDVKMKEYRYYIYPSQVADPFKRNYATRFPFGLNLLSIREEMKSLVGTHDFTSFCAAKTDVEDKVRTIFDAELVEEGEMLVFRYVGNGFLYNMVRILTGTLLEIGSGDQKTISDILAQKDRNSAGKTAPANGLYLWKVEY